MLKKRAASAIKNGACSRTIQKTVFDERITVDAREGLTGIMMHSLPLSCKLFSEIVADRCRITEVFNSVTLLNRVTFPSLN